MAKPVVLLTGASGTMGMESFKLMKNDTPRYTLRILVRGSEKNHKLFDEYEGKQGIEIIWGDLNNRDEVDRAVKGASLVLHVAAFVSPAADYNPKKAMEVNYGGTRNLIEAIKDLGQEETTKFVYIGTVAETGDRMPPIHWGRVGDPIKPSMFDYYAVSKVAAERYVIESGLKYWASLRQTGIIGPAMSEIRDAIMFHNCLNNVLEYCSDRDSGKCMQNLARYDSNGTLSEDFWGHIYNIGGGPAARTDTYSMYEELYGALGITELQYLLKPREIATLNFHGHYYEDSDKLNDYLHFRSDGMEYYYNSYLKTLGPVAPISKAVCKLPGGQALMSKAIGMAFEPLKKSEHGTVRFIKEDMAPQLEAYWGGKERWDEQPYDVRDFKRFKDWDTVIHLDHGYDESKPESELNLEDMKGAAVFRGGECLSKKMKKGDWSTKLKFKCQFGHEFMASPRLVLDGGHWCDECERKSWNYGQRAKGDPFFNQVWAPLHGEDELREYPKEVTELEV